jgi:DNA/RNA-binding domain of Phe-tRNA-synthetase-like protein
MPPQGETVHAPDFLSSPLREAVASGEEYVPASVRSRVRDMLRFGKYRPSGRAKPASEFLLRAAIGGTFPLISGPVDVNNAISLESGFPGSLFDTELSGRRLLLRRGTAGETYVFNASGQSIDLTDLLLVCRETPSGWEPCGNPVKDSEATKIRSTTTDVVAVLYVPADEPQASLVRWAARYAELLQSHCGAARSGHTIVMTDEAA